MNDIVEQYLFPSESNMERKHELLAFGQTKSMGSVHRFPSNFRYKKLGTDWFLKIIKMFSQKKIQDEANLVVRFGLGHDCTNQVSNTHIEKEITESPM